MNSILQALRTIVTVLETEEIPYMIVGGFAMSYYNRARFTADIDVVVQIHPHDVPRILAHFPDWSGFEEPFKQSVAQGSMFNITDFASGIRFDFMVYKDSDYNWTAFGRRRLVDFMGVSCKISTPEDLITQNQVSNATELRAELGVKSRERAANFGSPNSILCHNFPLRKGMKSKCSNA